MSEAKSETTRVRILVAVDQHGDFVCQADYGDDKDTMEALREQARYLSHPYCYSWVEADVPKLAINTIEGRATDA
jgi:hypothetical protein